MFCTSKSSIFCDYYLSIVICRNRNRISKNYNVVCSYFRCQPSAREGNRGAEEQNRPGPGRDAKRHIRGPRLHHEPLKGAARRESPWLDPGSERHGLHPERVARGLHGSMKAPPRFYLTNTHTSTCTDTMMIRIVIDTRC